MFFSTARVSSTRTILDSRQTRRREKTKTRSSRRSDKACESGPPHTLRTTHTHTQNQLTFPKLLDLRDFVEASRANLSSNLPNISNIACKKTGTEISLDRENISKVEQLEKKGQAERERGKERCSNSISYRWMESRPVLSQWEGDPRVISI